MPLLSPVSGAEALAKFARANNVSVVVLTLWFWGTETMPSRYLRALRTRLPHLRLVIMTDDVHHKRLELAADADRRRPGKKVAATREEELRWYYYSDHVLTISLADQRLIMASLSSSRAMSEARFTPLRHVYADGLLYPLHSSAPYAQRSGLAFVGNLNNPTNLHGLLWFIKKVWPRLRRDEPTLTLTVIGSISGGGAARLGMSRLLRDAGGTHVTGYLSDAKLGDALQRARVFIVPIRWATGILTKQTLAHVHGVPTVATTAAAEHAAPAALDAEGRGDAWSHRLGRYERIRVAAVAESAAEFAEAVLNVHRNESMWLELSINGARYAHSGGRGKGVCPGGLASDWLAFWAKMNAFGCVGGMYPNE